MRRFTAYIFDLDGVLCHTDKFHFAAWAALAKKLDLPFDASVNDWLRGVSRMESLDIVLGEKKDAFTAEQKKSFADEKNAIYRGYLQKLHSSYPVTFLALLHQERYLALLRHSVLP